MPTTELKAQDDVFRLPLPKAGKTERAYFDCGKPKDRAKGLALRVRSDGSRTWVFFYRFGGKLNKLTIGTATADTSGWTIARARALAHELRVKTDNGVNPADEKQKAEDAAQGAKTLAVTAEAYLAARERSMRPKTFSETARYLRKVWKPLHRKLVHEVNTDMIADRLKEIEKESGHVSRNRARSTLSSMFAWAIAERFSKQLRTNPVIGTSMVAESKPRDRVLSDAELVAIWKGAPASSYGRIIRLLMLTAQRRDEIAGLRWDEIKAADDSAGARIELSGDRTKNHRSHDVPLTALALEVLGVQPRIVGREFVFAERGNGFSGWSRSKAKLDETVKIEPWTLHDLRRTAATGMADIGIQPHVIEAALNHVSGHKSGVAGIYNRSTYAAERRAALEAWANYIKVALAKAEGANVVGLRDAR